MENLSLFEWLWLRRDKRADWMPLMGSFTPTFVICLFYVLLSTVIGPKLMKNRAPMNLKIPILIYNIFQIILSFYIFVGILSNGWLHNYSLICQPVDYSNDSMAVNMVWFSYIYYISKFTEFIDTMFFILRKKFSHVSVLHVIHHGTMPMSVWPGVRFTPGGHSTFFGLLNSLVHIFMYTYYAFASVNSGVIKWKQWITRMQLVQFVLVFFHSFQLLFIQCDFPLIMACFVGSHSILFFLLFINFYVKNYFKDHVHSQKVNKEYSGWPKKNKASVELKKSKNE